MRVPGQWARPIGIDAATIREHTPVSVKPALAEQPAGVTRGDVLRDALERQDALTIRRFMQDPAIPRRLQQFLDNWLRHHRGLEVSAAAARQEMRISSM